ncbi:MAG: cyanophycin synthetase, partial [Pseudomonadota bacterium]|nr:cyanophycin synthetase [Pseudomonadota bacterium]
HHQIVNAMSILATVQVLEEDLTSAVLSLGEMKAMDGRGRRHNVSLPDGELIVIDESYNANPESMVAALKTLGQFARLGQGRRIAVLGDMKELGGQGDALHKSLVEHIVNTDVDIVFTVGAQMKLLQEALPGGRRGAHAKSVDDLKSFLTREVHAGDAVMVKGSNSMRLSELVKCLVDLDVEQGFVAPIVQNEGGMS